MASYGPSFGGGGGTPQKGAVDAAGTPGQTDSKSTYAGPLGYAYDYANGDAGSVWNYLDPGDFFGKKASADVLNAGKEASARLQALSEQAWQRQMGGLQLALGSMNNYNGVLSNLYGVQTNYYDPANSGGVQGHGPAGGAGAGGPAGPKLPTANFQPPPGATWLPSNPAAPPPGSGVSSTPNAPTGGHGIPIGPQPAAPPPPPGGYTDPILQKIAAMLSGPAEARSGGGHF